MGDEHRDASNESGTDVEDAAPDVVEAAPIRRGMVLGGRYSIEKIIGRGGSGLVVRAHDRDLNQVVAIKIVRADLAGQRVWAARLAREVRLARQIHHPHVCRVFDFEQADGRVFLVMELAKGTLRDEIRSGAVTARPLADRISDARAVASALAAIHGAGIVHRDLSPQNVLRMGDGRLVLSDFGLATDASESTSVHGGTIAYMAPEVMRGDRSTVASDIWSLGALMYELVFGDKPRWSEGAAPEILTPVLGRRLTGEERAVVETCRACTVKDPRKRIVSATAAALMVTERRPWRMLAIRPWRRPVIWAAGLMAVAAVASGVLRSRPLWSGSRLALDTGPLIVPTGEPADWTDVSTVLAEVPGRIACMVGLPDKRTLRIVWGTPPRAEDIDTRSRRRRPSPLASVAYAEGCPDLSPDGKRLLYPGHVEDGRAFAFVSDNDDGSNGRPIVATAEPSHLSEPRWLAYEKAFSYDVDTRHIGIYSLETNRGVVVPEQDDVHISTSRWTNGNQVFLQKLFLDGHTEFVGHLWPSLAEIARFRLDELAQDLRSADGSTYYYSTSASARGVLVAVRLTTGAARTIGMVRDQFIRLPLFVDAGLSFLSVTRKTYVDVRQAHGSHKSISTGAYISHAAACGGGVLISETVADRDVITRRTLDGNLVAGPTAGPLDYSASCSADGRAWSYIRNGPRSGVVRCGDRGCAQVIDKETLAARMAPDGKRIVFVAAEKRGLTIYVITADGSDLRQVTETETLCSPEWSSSQTIWLSRRHGREFVWMEMDVDSGHETGRRTAGTTDCTNGDEDPASPVDSDVRVVVQRTAQVRLLPSRYLRAGN